MTRETTTITLTVELGNRELAILNARIAKMQAFLSSERPYPFTEGSQRREWTLEDELIGLLFTAIYSSQ